MSIFLVGIRRSRSPGTAMREFLIEDAKSKVRTRSVVGDPFLIEAEEARIYNPGEHYSVVEDDEYEECVEMFAKDGAVAHLFDLHTVYDFEVMS